MGKFRIEITDLAKLQIAKHYKSGNQASIKKLEKIFLDLEETPLEGAGKPEPLKGNLTGFWSRKLTQKID